MIQIKKVIKTFFVIENTFIFSSWRKMKKNWTSDRQLCQQINIKTYLYYLLTTIVVIANTNDNFIVPIQSIDILTIIESEHFPN